MYIRVYRRERPARRFSRCAKRHKQWHQVLCATLRVGLQRRGSRLPRAQLSDALL